MDKKDYILEKNKFKKKRALILEKISHLKSETRDKIVSIENYLCLNSQVECLENQIENARPKTENGERICKSCNCISMKYCGNITGGDGSEGEVYQCEICGEENFKKY